MTRAWSAWERFWFEPRSVAPVVLVRMAFGLIVLAWAISALPDAAALFGPNGVLAKSPHLAGGWSVLDLWNSATAAIFLLMLLAVAGVCLIAGVWPRAAAAVVFVVFVSLSKRDPFVGNAGDGLIRAFALYLSLAPGVGRVGDYPLRAPWALRLIQVQVSLLYLATVWAKLQGTTWPDGTAVAYAFRLEDLARFPVPDVMRYVAVAHLLTWAVLAIELSIGLLVWFGRLRPWVLLAGVCLHLGIEYRLRVGFFSWAILASYLAFVPADRAERILDSVGRWLRSPRWRRSGSTH
jgi:hypothetical protein